MKHDITSICFFFLFLCTAGLRSQETVFDSLQGIIRNEIVAGTYRFLATAEVYDSLAQAEGDSLSMGKGKNFLGMYAYFQGNHRQAIQRYLAALPYFEGIQDTFYTALVNNNIGAAYEYRHEPQNSIAYYKKALASFLQLQDSLWIANVYNNIGIQYNVAEEHGRALTYLDSARVLYTALQDSSMIATNLANSAEAYRLHGEIKRAIEMGHRFLNDFQKFHSTDLLANVYAMLGRAYLAENDLNNAQYYNDQSLQIRNAYGFSYQKGNNLETQSMIYEQKGDFRQALLSFKAFKTQQDSIMNKEKDDRITALLTEYDVAQKDQEIALLASRNEINTLRIDRANRQKLLIGLGALTLLISAIALFYLLKLKTATNRSLAEKNALISKALREKDILLREIHHRVKNNLQMISALLYLHGKSVDDVSAQEALLESQNRVQSMAMIHQNLYQDENLLNIGVRAYLEKLFDHLIASYNIEKERIAIRKEIGIDHLDVDTIVPLALIVNELISNALKYAFRDGRQGVIDVLLSQEDQKIIMQVSDNGMGWPVKGELPGGTSFGYKLIQILSDRLGARLDVQGGDGVKARLVIPYKAVA